MSYCTYINLVNQAIQASMYYLIHYPQVTLATLAMPSDPSPGLTDHHSPVCLATEQHLEGEGERSLVCSPFPKLVRLQSVQEKARAELRR